MGIWQDDDDVANDHIGVLAAMMWSFQAQFFELLYEDSIWNRNYLTQQPSAPVRLLLYNRQDLEWPNPFEVG